MPQNIASATLRKLLKLAEKREKLQEELNAITTKISAIYSGSLKLGAERKAKPGARKKRKKSARRGAVKESIIAAIKASGSKGIGVKELASTLGIKNANLHVWFATTGKTIKGLKKVGPGRYALSV